MQRLSIARSLRLALVALTFVLALVAAVGVSSLYSARQTYENALVRASQLATAAANLTSAGVAEAEVWRDVTGRKSGAARRQVSSAYRATADQALELARSDPQSEALVGQEIAAETAARQLADSGKPGDTALTGPLVEARRIANQLQDRQQTREGRARAKARSDSRRAIILVIVAGVLALLGALALITALVQNMRSPLDELVDATRDLAAGQLDRRVAPDGPRELQALGQAFNAMSGDLAEARERLEEQRRRLAVTIESLGDALLVTEQGGTRIAAVNPRATELVPELGVGEQTDDPGSPLPSLEAALASEQIVEHGDRTLAITAAALGSGSGTDGVVWTVRDISERARLERAKSDFVATASHELRSPLTSIKGFVELLAAQPATMTARQQEFVDIILRSTDRLVELVNDLLDVARIEADHVEINRRPIDVGEAIREVVELMGPRIEEKHQQLGVYIAPTLPLALADAVRVRQIIANLLTNAHLYTGDGGRVDIAAEAERAWVQIVVADSGVGMRERDVEHIFERFYRGAGDGRKAPGTGLGLSIVKSLVDLHDGEISLTSEPGKGTTFTVRLPAAVAARDPAHALEAIRGRRVLIVDDEPEIAQLIADQLAAEDVRVTVAADGARALELLATERFDAVTLDVMMPGLDGFEVLARLRADPDLKAIPVVFVSVFSGGDQLAGEWTVSKPIDADELRDVLDAAVRAGRSRVLVVGREELRPALEPALDELGIEHAWELTGAAAARACQERRFEVALVDVGIRNPQAVLQALDLRGRRRRRAVIMFSDGSTPVPAGIGRLGMEVVPFADAARALLAALREDGERAQEDA
jgi:signal transduction histidine kinase/DNA-binding response OmpR family regulator